MRYGNVAAGVLLAAVLSGGGALAQEAPAPPPAPPGSGQFVTREEYDKLLRQQEEMRKELEEMRKALAAQSAAATATAAQTPAPAATTATTTATTTTTATANTTANNSAKAATTTDTSDLQDQLDAMRDQIKRLTPGEESVVIAGDAAFGFVQPQHGASTFDAGISPLILWRPAERILIEGAFDASIETDADNNSSTSIDLTIANASFIVNDYLMLGAGLFVVPFGVYHNHFDPPWINQFPNDPLVFSDGGIAPSSEVGIFGRGAIPVGPTKVTYDAYVTNGPNLIVNDPDTAGSLNFDDFTDLNSNKAVGGRIGFLPVPSLDAGYSIMGAQVSPSGFQDVNAILQAVDLHYRLDAAWASGVFDFRGEWVWSNVGRATYGQAGPPAFGPITFDNDRNGGYVQLCYRPTKVDNSVLRNFEFGVRYDALNAPASAPGGNRETRWIFGVDYWLTPAAVLKAAYQLDDVRVGQSNDMLMLQLGLGL